MAKITLSNLFEIGRSRARVAAVDIMKRETGGLCQHYVPTMCGSGNRGLLLRFAEVVNHGYSAASATRLIGIRAVT